MLWSRLDIVLDQYAVPLPCTTKYFAPSNPIYFTNQLANIMLWEVCTRVFFGFFCMGELTVPSTSAFDPSTHLTLRDIAREDPSVVQIHLKVSKTDQERKGISIFIGKMGDDICPVAALTAYLAIRGQAEGLLFQFKDKRL